jgi:CRP-like cAMP-binding protein
MLSEEEIQQYSGLFNGLSPEDMAGLAQLARTRELAPGDIYIRKGSASQSIAFIQKGLIRTYYVQPNDEEITLMLRWENQFVASIDSIFRQKPSRYTYEALEETVLLEMDYAQARPLIDANRRLSVSRDGFLMMMLSQAMDRIETFCLFSPEERYLNLLQEKPGLVERVPDKYLATMLGITPVSLSRIRKRLSRRN